MMRCEEVIDDRASSAATTPLPINVRQHPQVSPHPRELPQTGKSVYSDQVVPQWLPNLHNKQFKFIQKLSKNHGNIWFSPRIALILRSIYAISLSLIPYLAYSFTSVHSWVKSWWGTKAESDMLWRVTFAVCGYMLLSRTIGVRCCWHNCCILIVDTHFFIHLI